MILVDERVDWLREVCDCSEKEILVVSILALCNIPVLFDLLL